MPPHTFTTTPNINFRGVQNFMSGVAQEQYTGYPTQNLPKGYSQLAPRAATTSGYLPHGQTSPFHGTTTIPPGYRNNQGSGEMQSSQWRVHGGSPVTQTPGYQPPGLMQQYLATQRMHAPAPSTLRTSSGASGRIGATFSSTSTSDPESFWREPGASQPSNLHYQMSQPQIADNNAGGFGRYIHPSRSSHGVHGYPQPNRIQHLAGLAVGLGMRSPTPSILTISSGSSGGTGATFSSVSTSNEESVWQGLGAPQPSNLPYQMDQLQITDNPGGFGGNMQPSRSNPGGHGYSQPSLMQQHLARPGVRSSTPSILTTSSGSIPYQMSQSQITDNAAGFGGNIETIQPSQSSRGSYSCAGMPYEPVPATVAARPIPQQDPYSHCHTCIQYVVDSCYLGKYQII